MTDHDLWERLEQYRKALRSFDHQFEYSDDAAYVARTRAKLDALRHEQVAIDPDGTIWDELAKPKGLFRFAT